MARIRKTGGKKAGVKKLSKLSNNGKTSARTRVRAAAKDGARASKKKSVLGTHAKVRHMRDRRGNLHVWDEELPPGLVARPSVARPKSTYQSYFEFVENKDKKKKLEFQVTQNTEPPPGYEFVPIGNPALTAACKELSREQEAMIFIVSAYSREEEAPGWDLGLALNRVGHHIRERIVEQARASLGELADMPQVAHLDIPEPIPESQEEINKQADAAIRDLFPRIPNADRQTILEHSFKKGARAPDGKPLVGLAAELTLSRRVQLAVISHIRHTHTRYDELLRETSWVNARRAVEELCLDILVKWRGDEENGRDQLDEILREVVVIPDSESEDEDEEDEEDEEDDDDDDDTDDEDTDMTSGESSDDTVASTGERPRLTEHHVSASGHGAHPHPAAAAARLTLVDEPSQAEHVRAPARRTRGFQRYQAVVDQAWQQAVNRQRPGHGDSRPGSQTGQRPTETETYYLSHGAERGEGAGPSNYHARKASHGNAVYTHGPPRDTHQPHTYLNTPERVTASRSQAPVYYYEGQRNGDSESNGFAPIVGSRSAFRSSTEVRTVVSRPPPEELKDLLLPSIEPPTSPLASQFSAQRLDDGRRGRPSEYWQSRQTLHPDNAGRQTAPSQMPEEGFITIYRTSGNTGRAEPMPATYRSGDDIDPRNSGFIRSEVRKTVSHRPVTVADPSYGQPHPVSLPQNNYAHADGAYSRQEDPRFTSAHDYRTAFAAVPEATPHAAANDERSGAHYRDAARPIVVEDRRTWTQSYGAPVPNDGSSARYSDASRPIVVEDEHTWRQGAFQAPVNVGGAPDQVLFRRRGREATQQYNAGDADPYSRPPEEDRRLPLDFIPVSNRFPRPHAPLVVDNQLPTYNQTYARGPPPIDSRPTPVAVDYGYDQRRYVQDIPAPRANLPRQERVVRYEFVQDGQMDGGQVPYHNLGHAYRSQEPVQVAGPPRHAYGATPAAPQQDCTRYL